MKGGPSTIGSSSEKMTGEGFGKAWANRWSGFPFYPTRNKLIFMTFLAFVVARYIQLGARRDILATIRFEFLLGVLVTVMVGSALGSRKPELGRSNGLLYFIGLLFGAMIIQVPFAADPVYARQIFMDRVIKFAILTFLMIVLIESPRYLRYFVFVFLFSLFYITLEAVRGLITGGLVWQNQGIMRLHGAVPIYMHPNSLGGVATGPLPFVVFLYPHLRAWYLKIGLLALLATSLICIVYSGSRTAYIGFLGFLLWWFIQTPNKIRFLVRFLVVGAVFVSIIPDQYIERFESIGGQEKEGHSSAARLVILKDAVAIFAEHPIGVGVGSFPAVRMAEFGRYQDTHNLYLEVATNLGIQGLLVFLGLIWIMMSQFRNNQRIFKNQILVLKRSLPPPREIPREVRTMINRHFRDLDFLVVVAQSAGGFIFTRLVVGFFGMDLYEVYWWFGCGLAISLAGISVQARRNTRWLLSMVNGLVDRN